MGELSKQTLVIDDTPTRNMTEIAAICRRYKRKHKLGLLIVDYLGLIQPENHRDPREIQVAKIARRLKALARELKIPILCLAQLNRQTESSGDKKPRLSNLRESGAIEQDADVVMFVHRAEYYAKDAMPGEAEIIIAKQRTGPTGTVKLVWQEEFIRFQNAAKAEVYSSVESACYRKGVKEFDPSDYRQDF
jgi:replicative DNA helicase